MTKLFAIKGRYPLTGEVVTLKIDAASWDEAYDYGYSLFDKALRTVTEIQPGSEQDKQLPTPEDYQARHEPEESEPVENPFHNPEYSGSLAETIAEESETFAKLDVMDSPPFVTEERVWLGTIVDKRGKTRQVQLLVTSDEDDFIDENF